MFIHVKVFGHNRLGGNDHNDRLRRVRRWGVGWLVNDFIISQIITIIKIPPLQRLMADHGCLSSDSDNNRYKGL